ncbi:hypothetical protein O3P69_015708 [Scylla paramamosain]|uniref:Reverse transcriptase domain-containing protein n=1 Tax=Scylla paramamosain TaxID=85552 RepID=A0AAW0S920_SCYPA
MHLSRGLKGSLNTLSFLWPLSCANATYISLSQSPSLPQATVIWWSGSVSAPFCMHSGMNYRGIRADPAPVQPMRGLTQRNAERSRVGCHVANVAPNNFSCADDLTLVCPSAAALNDLLRICEEFASKHYIKFSTAKSVYMCIPPKRVPALAPPVMRLGAPSWNTCERCHGWATSSQLIACCLTDHLPFCGAFMLCVAVGVKSFPEVRRAAAYSAVRRVRALH